MVRYKCMDLNREVWPKTKSCDGYEGDHLRKNSDVKKEGLKKEKSQRVEIDKKMAVPLRLKKYVKY